ncbi:MAG: peptide ABC transporter permease [Anaerolineaceae bacterium]|nr:peptide ABC transporter permease [Anaerolineaceae bacterium]
MTSQVQNPELPDETDAIPTASEERIYVASQLQLMWWKFRKHRMAVISAILILLMYVVAIIPGFLAPFDPNAHNSGFIFAPPQPIRFVDAEGNFHLRPFIYGLTGERDMDTLAMIYETDTSQMYPLHFFVRGASYKLLGFIETDIHLFGIDDPEGDVTMYLLGSDRNGRDLLSRMIYGTQISMSIGLVGVLLSLVLGIFFGGISGYYGGAVDNIIQRLIEFLRSIPSIPLWLTLSAALPSDWTGLQIYLGITIILSFVGWTGLARVVRGRFLSLREEDFVLAAQLYGASERRLIFRHMVPLFLSHIIASLTLAIPNMILSETALSFLGLGLRPPTISWGVLLKEAQNVQSLALAPWLFLPGIAVVVAVLAFNFLGDGLRDAADPYAR